MTQEDKDEIRLIVREEIERAEGNRLMTCDCCDGTGVKYDYEIDGRVCTKCKGTGEIPTKEKYVELF